MRLLAVLTLLIVGALSLVLLGGSLAWRQQMLLDRAQPTSALVRQSQRTAEGVRIVYEYVAGGAKQVSDRLTPLPSWTPLPDADTLPARYKVGQTVEIYVSDTDPRAAYLLRRSHAYPYLLVWAGLVLALITGVVLRRSGMMDLAPTPLPVRGTEWCALAGTRTPVAAMVGRLIEALAWVAVTATTGGLYLIHAPWPIDPAITLVALSVAPAVWGLVRAWRWSELAGALAAVELTTMKARLELDRPVIAHLAVRVRRPLPVRELRVALVCRRRSGLRAQKLFVCSQVLVSDQTLHPQRPCGEQCRFDVPHRKRRTATPFERFALPRVEWCFEVHVRPVQGGRFIVRFPVDAALAAGELEQPMVHHRAA